MRFLEDPRVYRYRSVDTETPLFSPGRIAPRIICASTARVVDGRLVGDLIPGSASAIALFHELLRPADPTAPCSCPTSLDMVGATTTHHVASCRRQAHTIAFANAAYDLAVACEADQTLLPVVFQALREGRVHDILPAEALNAIYGGHLGTMPNGMPLVNPATGEQTKRYSLALATLLSLGRVDAKKNDAWQKSYALLEGVPVEHWPTEARVYPVDDAVNTLEVALAQIFGRAGAHEWTEVPRLPPLEGIATKCRHCGEELTFAAASPLCEKAQRHEPHKNLENLPAQVEAAFAAHLGSCHGLRTDPQLVEALAAEAEAKQKIAVARFQKKGWIREDESEDQAAVKHAIAAAYGATGKCSRCGGSGKVRNSTWIDCRGEKVRGRYQGCKREQCVACSGELKVAKIGNEVTCKNVFNENEVLVEVGCDGTGFDLSTVPMLPRTDKLGVSTDRDTAMESGDDDVSDFAENEFHKSLTTYIPWLRTGISRPLSFSPNVLVATGRYSYEGSPIHQMPRKGGERRCIRARGAWCGYPIETVLGSTDYEAGELDTLAQLCYWIFGYSQMRDVINATGKPGILHSDLASEVLGISLEEFLARLKAKDTQAKDFRQAMKPINFGAPSGMGSPKIVLTNRKKNAGFTVCENGPAVNDDGKPGYWGVRFCLLTGGAKQCGTEKIMEWGGGKTKYPCAPICRACADVVENMLKPAYFRRYPEIKDYLKWVDKKIKNGEPAPCAVWDAEAGAPRIVRERHGCDYSAFANNGFQGMLSDIIKDAYVTATRECYLGIKDDGSLSPLAGCRLPLVVHDEPVSELILSTAHLSGPRIADIMIASGQKMAPDVTWRAESAIAFYLDKNMEPVYVDSIDDHGKQFKKLVPWEPQQKKAA